jgi:8-oxo-dGTP pyrophosphatase MutT (NUDIX family)
MFRVRVAALCAADGRVLLAKHVRGSRATYLLPGGGVASGETAIAAVEREVREEAGTGCEVGALRYVVETLATDGTRHLVQVVFAATLTGEPGASADPRVAECAWHPIADLRTLPFHPDVGTEIANDLDAGFDGCRYLLAPWRI